jgi:hypothetical protein
MNVSIIRALAAAVCAKFGGARGVGMHH